MKTLITLLLMLAQDAYVPTDAERARWTLQDMQSWRIALEAYKTDHKSYPAAATLQEAVAAIAPMYIRVAPVNDAWGRPYLYERTGEGFRLVSAGADGEFNRASWTTAAKDLAPEADAVISDAARFWFRSWEFR